MSGLLVQGSPLAAAGTVLVLGLRLAGGDTVSGAKMPVLLVCVFLNLFFTWCNIVSGLYAWAGVSFVVAMICGLAWVFSWRREL